MSSASCVSCFQLHWYCRSDPEQGCAGRSFFQWSGAKINSTKVLKLLLAGRGWKSAGRGKIAQNWSKNLTKVRKLLMQDLYYSMAFISRKTLHFQTANQEVTNSTKDHMKSFSSISPLSKPKCVGIICVIYSQLCPFVPRRFCQFCGAGQGSLFAGRGLFPRGRVGRASLILNVCCGVGLSEN